MATTPTTRAKATPAAAAEAPAAAPAKAAAKAVAAPKVQQEAVEQAQAAALKSYEDIVGFGKETVEALVQAGSIFSRGVQDISTKVIGIAQNVVEQNVSVSKQILAAKTIRDVVDLQTAFSREQFDHLVNEGSHLSDLSVKLVEDSFAPLGQKVNEAIDKLVKAA